MPPGRAGRAPRLVHVEGVEGRGIVEPARPIAETVGGGVPAGGQPVPGVGGRGGPREERDDVHDLGAGPEQLVAPGHPREREEGQEDVFEYEGGVSAFIGYLNHPYLSVYTGRGCKSRCTFCLWPQTVGGHNYRVRSIPHVIEEVKYCLKAFPQMKEIFFDDDTLTDNLPRVEALAREIGKLGMMWSCNAKANVPRDVLKVMKENGCRVLLVGYESGNQQILHNIKKGIVANPNCVAK